MRTKLYQGIKSMNSWVFVGMAIVLAVILTTGLNSFFAWISGAGIKPITMLFATVDAILIPAIIAPILINILKRIVNLEDSNRQLQHEIAERRHAEQAAQRRAANLQAINDLAIECAAALPDADLPKLITDKLHSITNAVAVGLSAYEAQERVLMTRYLSVSGHLLAAANKILGRSFIGLTSPVSAEALNMMLTDGYMLADSLTETTFGAIPRPISATLQTTFGIGSFVCVGFCCGGELWGAAVIALRAQQPPPERALAMALANVAAVALRRQKTEQALRREKQFSDDILAGSPGIFSLCDDQTRLVRWNKKAEQILGYSAQDLAGMCATDFFEGQDKELISRQMRQAFTAGEADAEATVVTRTGGHFSYYFVGRRTLVDSKPYLLSFGIDIADRKLAEAERQELIAKLEAKNAELERFTYTVSHDLRSPLITIRGFLGFLEKDALAGNIERVRADMVRIIEATDKMQRLLTDLLELSRIGRIMNPPQLVPFETIGREAVELVHGRLAARGVSVEIASDLPAIYGDRARLVEVVQNLVDNAAKFMGDQSHPRIEIGAHVDAGDQPVFFVRDNGMGIDPRYHDKVFGLFNKLDPRTEGTGVGLALVKRIVEVHGGRIWVESEGPGQGTTCYFSVSQEQVNRPGQAT